MALLVVARRPECRAVPRGRLARCRLCGNNQNRSKSDCGAEHAKTWLYKRRIITVRKTISIAVTLLVLIGAMPLLAACHTTAGAGQDISATGHAVTHAADKLTP